ncbi:Sialic acid TRAP transporter small permease protein SiaQ [Caprobacter fermentans]|uniref:Sialic acid TRAP transporter small permease protein SiaQ n=1 Tax=Caproicibacter fermentans TaxID=2576756 RepID=A0A6N8I4G7_9FIRM|nr:TRAP transporter small permease [Caproicibacter fermentans]MVB12944.1 Sialic acid TRAP transporter small permease protein SiaQ [Caproicibacter fermentans]OCN02515.1 C4-dicarboxylate ABC transporter permease [Clostridium sp. W14A]
MNTLISIKKVVDKVMEWCCVIILAFMTVLVTYQVITRYFFNKPSAFSEILAQNLFVWLVMFGSAYVFGLREHLAITILKDKMSGAPRLAVEILTEIVIAAFAWTVMIVGGYGGAMKQMTTLDAALQIPVGWIYSAIPFCGIIILFYVIYNVISLVHQYRAPSAEVESR